MKPSRTQNCEFHTTLKNNNKRMKYILFITVLFFTANSFAQGILQIEQKEITLKDLKADDKVTEVIYKMKNTGNQPIIISRISPLSSQLKVAWDREPLVPGKSGEIKVSFPSTSVPEKFSYGITVFSNALVSREQLKLTVNIVDNPQKPDLLYRMGLDGLKFKTNSVQFDTIYTWQTLSDTLYYFNTRPDSTGISTNYLPQHIGFQAIPAKIAPGKKGMLIITYDASKKNDYGHQYESTFLSLNNSKDYKNRVSVTANIVEDFRKLSKKELTDAPLVNFDKKEVNFGDIKPGDKVNCDFTLTNTGKRDLIIRKTATSCGCTAVNIGQNTIAPGKSSVIRATFDSAGKSGRQYKTVTVITNDPKNPETQLSITGEIK